MQEARHTAENAAPSPLFQQSLTAVQGDLYAFIVMLLAGKEGADDVLQETNLILLQNAAEYDPEKHFLPWAKAFAYNRARTYLKAEKRERLVFDDDLVQLMSEEVADEQPKEDCRVALLRECMQGLAPLQLHLIQSVYFLNRTAEEVARKLHRTTISVHVQIHRIRKLLAACIERKLAEENDPKGGGK